MSAFYLFNLFYLFLFDNCVTKVTSFCCIILNFCLWLMQNVWGLDLVVVAYSVICVTLNFWLFIHWPLSMLSKMDYITSSFSSLFVWLYWLQLSVGWEVDFRSTMLLSLFGYSNFFQAVWSTAAFSWGYLYGFFIGFLYSDMNSWWCVAYPFLLHLGVANWLGGFGFAGLPVGCCQGYWGVNSIWYFILNYGFLMTAWLTIGGNWVFIFYYSICFSVCNYSLQVNSVDGDWDVELSTSMLELAAFFCTFLVFWVPSLEHHSMFLGLLVLLLSSELELVRFFIFSSFTFLYLFFVALLSISEFEFPLSTL